MKNNKGFTLVELLGVITIIAILSLIAIPAVTKTINNSRKNHFESQKKLIIIAAKSYAQSNRSVLPRTVGETTTITIQTLKDSGYLKDDVKNSIGVSCMNNSTINIYKESTNKYKYDVLLNCDN